MSRATTAEAFISKASSGEIKLDKPKKTNSNLSNVRFTDTQWKLIQNVLEVSNIRTQAALFSSAAEYMRVGFNYLDYVDYLDFLTGVGVKGTSKAYTIQKNRTYDFFYELYEDYRVNWVNIRVRGVIILSILHYAKNKLNLDLNELLKALNDE